MCSLMALDVLSLDVLSLWALNRRMAGKRPRKAGARALIRLTESAPYRHSLTYDESELENGVNEMDIGHTEGRESAFSGKARSSFRM